MNTYAPKRRGCTICWFACAISALAGSSVSNAQTTVGAVWPKYAVTDLTPKGAIAPYSARAWSVAANAATTSNVGAPMVVGEFGLGTTVPNRPMAWTSATGAVDMMPTNAGSGVARSVNSMKVATGTFVLPLAGPLPANRAFLATPDASPPRFLAGIGGHGSWGYGVNDANVIAGSSYDRAGNVHATVWFTSSTMPSVVPIDLGTLGGSTSEAYAINKTNAVVGVASNIVGINRAFYVSAVSPGLGPVRPPFDLGSLVNSGWSVARDINAASMVVGQSEAASTGGTIKGSRAVMWNPLSTAAIVPILNLGTLKATDTASDALSINNRNEVVGWSGMSATSSTIPAVQRAFYWKDGKMYDLNTMIASNSGWILQVATDINDQGQIVGWGQRVSATANTSTQVRAFLLTPLATTSSAADR